MGLLLILLVFFIIAAVVLLVATTSVGVALGIQWLRLPHRHKENVKRQARHSTRGRNT